MYTFNAMDLILQVTVKMFKTCEFPYQHFGCISRKKLEKVFSPLHYLIVNSTDGFNKFMSILTVSSRLQTLDALVYGGKLDLGCTSISMSISSLSTIALVSTTIFSLLKTSSVVTSWLVLFFFFINQFFPFKFFLQQHKNLIKGNNKKNNYMNQLLRLPLLKYTHTKRKYIYIYIHMLKKKK